jgi:hypothetical protein
MRYLGQPPGWLFARAHLLALTACLLVQQADAGPINGSATGQLPLPGGLADSGGRTGYLTSLNHGIEAIDLMSGDVLWSSYEAEVPVLLSQDRLFTQAGTKRNRLRVLVFDLTRKGEVVLESEPIVFPEWVVTASAPGHSFKAEWQLEKEYLVLTWQARAWYEGRPKAAPALIAEARKQAEGVVRIHLVTGQVAKFPVDTAGLSLGVAVPWKDLEKKAVRWQGMLGGQYKAIILEQEGDRQKLVLLTWDRSGVPTGQPRELFTGHRLALMPTLDEKMVCIREVPPSPDLRPTNEDQMKYAWALISLETGETVARVAYEASTQALTVIGPRLFVQQAGPIRGSITQTAVNTRTLKAIELKTGKFLWQRALAEKSVQAPER